MNDLFSRRNVMALAIAVILTTLLMVIKGF